jgi:hypothetical protein
VACPKCKKEIAEADIEAEKAYCCSCMEWFTLKEYITAENPSPKNFTTKDAKKSYVVYFCLVLALCTSTFLFSILHYSPSPMEHTFGWLGLEHLLNRGIPRYAWGLINALYRLLAYGGMGLLGLYLSTKNGFKHILNDEIEKAKNIVLVLSVGIAMGIFFIVYDDVLIGKIFDRGFLLYMESRFPTAVFASIAEGIGDQILNMLRVAFFVWLLSKIIKSEDSRAVLFRVVAIFCSLVFAVEHIPSTMFYSLSINNIFELPQGEFVLVYGAYGTLSLVCTYFFKRFGLLSAITIHFICDIIWRVLWAYIRWGI